MRRVYEEERWDRAKWEGCKWSQLIFIAQNLLDHRNEGTKYSDK